MELIIDVTGVRVLSRYILELTFDTGEVKVVDFESLLNGPIFAERYQPVAALELVRRSVKTAAPWSEG
ncbi:MAG: DUF2442 domain-containing protein [Pseudonocardiales bacterium]